MAMALNPNEQKVTRLSPEVTMMFIAMDSQVLTGACL
jgi:hypothetical protein